MSDTQNPDNPVANFDDGTKSQKSATPSPIDKSKSPKSRSVLSKHNESTLDNSNILNEQQPIENINDELNDQEFEAINNNNSGSPRESPIPSDELEELEEPLVR